MSTEVVEKLKPMNEAPSGISAPVEPTSTEPQAEAAEQASAKLSSLICISFSQERPIKIQPDLLQGTFEYYLAPRIE